MRYSRKKSKEPKINWKEKRVFNEHIQAMWLIKVEDVSPLIEKYALDINPDELENTLNHHLGNLEFQRELIDYSPQANDKKKLFEAFQYHVKKLQELCQIFTSYGSPCELFKDDQQTEEKQWEQWSVGSGLIYRKLIPLLEECSTQFDKAVYNLEKYGKKNLIAIEKKIKDLQSDAEYCKSEIANREDNPNTIRYPEELEELKRVQLLTQEALQKQTEYLQSLKEKKPASKGNSSTVHAYAFIEILYVFYEKFCPRGIKITWSSSDEEYKSEFVNFIEGCLTVIRRKFSEIESGNINKFHQNRLAYLLENMPQSNVEIGRIAERVRKRLKKASRL